jgi:hypothetical protein
MDKSDKTQKNWTQCMKKDKIDKKFDQFMILFY